MNFNNIAGYEKEKAELKGLCEIFTNRKEYEAKGAKMPKGVIFYGEPGTGKTLFLKVMASVCNLEVFAIDPSNDSETNIKKSIKKAFTKAAKKKSPCIVFFDEMDKYLPNPYERYNTDNARSVMTQLLTLIDGLDSSPDIIFVATCNDYATLPETLVRPGRIDKKIQLGLPDYASRKEIIELYLVQTACDFKIPVEDMAKSTSGLSCAALQTIVNECILHSDEDGGVSYELFKRVVMEIKDEDIPRDRSVINDTITACRNVGIMLVARHFNNSDYTLNLYDKFMGNRFFENFIFNNGDLNDFDDDDDYDDEAHDNRSFNRDDSCDLKYFSKTDYLHALSVMFGGYAAQEIFFNKTYDNNSMYISGAQNVFLKMLENGMFGLRYANLTNSDLFSFDDYDEKILNLMFDTFEDCHQRAKEILEDKKELIGKLVDELVKYGELSRVQCELLIV